MRKLLLLAGICSLLLLAWSAEVESCRAQESAEDAVFNPQLFGLDIPAGKVSRPTGRVVTRDEADQAVVARQYVQIGDHQIVLLPDGQLAIRKPSEVTVTERPFEAASKDAIAARLTEKEFAGFSTKQTRRYLYVYNTSDGFAEAVSRIMETMFPGVVLHAKARKIPHSEPETPMVVIMFKTEGEYQNYRKMPPGVLAYYHILSNQVVMYEESKLAEVKPELALRQSISMIAHEGAHQILANIGVQKRLSIWPMWLSEGMAEYLAPTTTDSRLTWKGAGHVNDMRMFELENYLQVQGTDGTGGKMIEQTAAAARLTSTGYAAAWALTHYLAKEKRREFNEFVLEISKREPLEGSLNIQPPGVIPENVEVFKTIFGDDLAAMEKGQIAHLKRLPYNHPFADQPHLVATIEFTLGGRSQRAANLSMSPVAAQKWISETMEKVPEAARATSQRKLYQLPDRKQAAQFASEFMRGG